MPIIALSVQNTASAQGMPNYQRNQAVSRLKANVPSALNRFTRGQPSSVFGDGAGGHFRAQRQRTLNGNSFIIQDRNPEGYPRAVN
jgi:hypothetical protein